MSMVLYDTPGPKARRRSLILTVVSILLFVLLAGWMFITLSRAGMLKPELWTVLFQPDLAGLLGTGLLATFKVAVTAMLLSIVVGTVIAAASLTKSQLLRGLLRGWIEVFRGLPLLLLIFFLYLGGPAVGIEISTFWALVIGLVLYNGAVIAEIFRAGILSLPKGQAEAAAAIGLSNGEIFRIILLPQSVRRMLPALISQLVTLLKETSFGFVVGYTELLRNARTAVEYLGGDYSLPVYTLIAVVYIVISCVLSWLARRAEAQL